MKTFGDYVRFLQTLKGNPAAIDREKERLGQQVRDVAAEIKSLLTPITVPSLLWDLAFREIKRFGPQIGEPVSDLAGHTRFLRSLCAAVPFSLIRPSKDPKTDELLALCGQLWQAMFFREMIDDLKTAESTSEDRPKHTMASMMSLLNAVQGEITFAEQIDERVRSLFTPFSKTVIEPTLGLTPEETVRGFQKVRSILADRWNKAMNLSRPMMDRFNEYKNRYDAGDAAEELAKFGLSSETADAGKLLKSAFDIFDTLLHFSSQDLAPELIDRSTRFLEEFSFRPGEVNQSLVSPNDDDIVRTRPFARIGDDTFALLDVGYCSYAAPKRLLECFDSDQKRQRLNRRRDQILEIDAANLFRQVVQPDLVIRNYYLPIGPEAQFVERDLLLLKGSCLILVESKASPLRPLKGRNDKLSRIATDVERTIQEGYEQACDVIRYFRNALLPVPIFDSDKKRRKQIAELDLTKITTVFTIVFLDAYYGLIATDLSPWLKVDESIGYPWAVDRDTFESIILKLDTYEKLTAFLHWRRMVHGVAYNEDEAVFAGYYLMHGSCAFPKDADFIQLDPSYADIFEAEYFRRKGVRVEGPRESVGPPIMTSMFRSGEKLMFEVDGKIVDSISLDSEARSAARYLRETKRRDRIGRNSPCPCGSGRKFKLCCLLR